MMKNTCRVLSQHQWKSQCHGVGKLDFKVCSFTNRCSGPLVCNTCLTFLTQLTNGCHDLCPAVSNTLMMTSIKKTEAEIKYTFCIFTYCSSSNMIILSIIMAWMYKPKPIFTFTNVYIVLLSNEHRKLVYNSSHPPFF